MTTKGAVEKASIVLVTLFFSFPAFVTCLWEFCYRETKLPSNLL